MATEKASIPTTINIDLFYGQDNKLAWGVTVPSGNTLNSYTWEVGFTAGENGRSLLTVADASITKNTTDGQIEITITQAQMLSSFDYAGDYWYYVYIVDDATSEKQVEAMGVADVSFTGKKS